MATWLVHIRIAERLLERFPLPRREFLAGNIAADCGIPDGSGGFMPPKQVTHWTEGSKGRCDYAAFAKQMFPLARTEEEYAFLLGYYAHLITDCLWVREINNPTKQEYAQLYQNDRTEYYRRVKADWYDADAAFLQQHPKLAILAELSAVRGFDSSVIPYYGRDNVQLQIEHIVEFYAQRKYDGRSFVYFTPQQADEFVTLAAEEIAERLKEFI